MLVDEALPVDEVEVVLLALIGVALQHSVDVVLPFARNVGVHEEDFAVAEQSA